MESIRLRNLKSLSDTGVIDVLPITVMVGENSSGKSSFIRCLPLLKQSAESKTLGTILWAGKYVDYGSFLESLNNNGSSNEISFSLNFKYQSRNNRSIGNAGVTISVCGNEHEKGSYTEIKYIIHKNEMIIKTDSDSRLISCFINGRDFTKLSQECYVGYKGYNVLPVLYINRKNPNQMEGHYIPLRKEIERHVHHRTSEEMVVAISKTLKFDDDVNLRKALTNKVLMGEYAAKKIEKWNSNETDFENIKNSLIFRSLHQITDEIADGLMVCLMRSVYITPLRATADRYYRIQNTSIDDLDPNGSNLAMFLYAKKAAEIRDINEWLSNEIGFTISIDASQGHVSIFVIDDNTGSKTNITDNGFGISQILPVLVQIWEASRHASVKDYFYPAPTIITIEQPELHLHPKMQTKVGLMLAKAMKMAKGKNIDLRIIIETHSQELINALGKSIDGNIISKNDVAVYLVEKSSKSLIRRSHFDEGGFLQNWPYGFFDGE